MAKKKQPRRLGGCYTLEVSIIGGRMTEAFVQRNPVCSRTIEILGKQTLANLHEAIFQAFDRWDEHDASQRPGRPSHSCRSQKLGPLRVPTERGYSTSSRPAIAHCLSQYDTDSSSEGSFCFQDNLRGQFQFTQ